MRSFLLVVGGFLLAASSIFAAPVGDFERRSSSSADLGDTVFARAIETISYGGSVPEDHKATIAAAIHAHVAALPAGHEHKNAVKAHVMGEGWHSNEHDTRTHATVGFYRAGSRNSKNLIGGTQHILPRDVFVRAIETITHGGSVPAEHKASIEAAIHAHVAALPAGHEHKNAVKAHVMGPGWHSNDDDPRTHATVGFYRAGSRNSKNLIGGTQHILPRDVFARAIETITHGGSVPAEHKASIEAAIHAHVAALPAGHEHKNAVKAHVMGPGWHSNDDDPRTHATVGFYRAGSRNSKNLIGGTQHILPRDVEELESICI